MAAKPIVDGLEREFQDELRVLRINVLDQANNDLLKEYGFLYTPTFIFLDGEGDEEWRITGAIDPERVRQSLDALK